MPKFESYPDNVVGTANPSGEQISISGTNSIEATTVHAPPAQPDAYDELTIEAVGVDPGVRHKVTLMWGSDLVSDYVPVIVSPEVGPIVIIDSRKLQRGRPVKAFADTADVILLYVKVGKVTP
jgi:hypothetical protein